MYEILRQAHDAFVFGAPAAALALMRSVMEIVVRDHYGASNPDLELYERIDIVASRLPRRANAFKLHDLRKLSNQIVHGSHHRTLDPKTTEKRAFELEIVSLLFVLRALIEGAPQSNAIVPRNFRSL